MHYFKNLAVSVIFTSTLISSGATGAEKIRFNFNPPKDVNYTQIMNSMKKLEYQTGQSQTDASQAEVSINLTKSANGYNMTAVPISMTMYRDGQEIDSPLLALLNNLVTKYVIDSNGQLLSISGYDEFLAEVQKSLPPDMLKSISSVLNKEVLIAKENAEWDGRIGYFAGAEVEIGEKWLDTTDFQLPTGEVLVFYTVTSFDEIIDCNGRGCVKISFNYNSNAIKLSGIAGVAIDKVASTVGDSLVVNEMILPELFGEGYRIIDPGTMLIYDEYSNRTIRLEVASPGTEPMIVTIYEEKEYDYAYEK